MKIIFQRLLPWLAMAFLGIGRTLAQEPNLSKLPGADAKIKAWVAYCESLRLNNNGASDNFVKLEQAGQKGLQLISAGDLTDQSKCFFYIAIGDYYQTKFDSAQSYFYKSLAAAQQGHNTAQITKACVALIPVNFQLQQPDKVEACKSILQSIADTAHNELLLQDLDYALGSYYQQKLYYSTAQDYFIKSIQLREKEVDTTQIAKKKFDYAIQCDMLSKLYLNTQMNDKSLDALRKGQRFASVSPTVGNRLLSSFVEAYTSSGNIDSALFYNNRLENETRNNPMFPSEVVSSDLNIGLYYIDKGQYARAIPFLNKADTIVDKVKSPYLTFQSQMVRGRYLEETGKYDQSMALLTRAMPVAKQLNTDLYGNISKYMALDEKGKGNYPEALRYYEEYVKSLDTVTKQKLSRTFADLETHYQTNEKEQRIQSLNKENRLRVLELQNASRQRMLLIVGLAGLAVISLLLYFIYRSKEKLNLVLNEKNTRLDQLNHHLTEANETKARLFGIIGHDLRAPVSKIVQLLQLQKERPDLLSPEARSAHEARLKKASENVLETMEDLLTWSKSQMEHFTPAFAQVPVYDLLQKEISLLEEQSTGAAVRIDNQVPANFVQSSDSNFLSVISRNLLQNAVKHGSPAQPITIEAKGNQLIFSNFSSSPVAARLNEKLSAMEVDSGASGLGLQIAADLAARINSKLYFRERIPGTLEAVLSWEQTA